MNASSFCSAAERKHDEKLGSDAIGDEVNNILYQLFLLIFPRIPCDDCLKFAYRQRG